MQMKQKFTSDICAHPVGVMMTVKTATYTAMITVRNICTTLYYLYGFFSQAIPIWKNQYITWFGDKCDIFTTTIDTSFCDIESL